MACHMDNGSVSHIRYSITSCKLSWVLLQIKRGKSFAFLVSKVYLFYLNIKCFSNLVKNSTSPDIVSKGLLIIESENCS